jgi:tetratricopeptide (TPR) repeat protein
MKKGSSEKDKSTQLSDAIVTFEQILEAIPTDRLALETLSDAYEQLGEKAKALEYYTRLASVILEDGDKKAAPELSKKLRELGGNDAEIQQVIDFLDHLVAPDEEEMKQETASKASARKKGEPIRRRGTDITAELALAWNLVQAGELTQDEYSSVVNDLTESSSRNNNVPVSVLHVLRDRTFKNYERVLTFISTSSGIPIVPLAGFELQKDANSLLPMDFAMHRGAIVFEMMGKEPLIAILNPYDTELKKDIEELMGRKCHYYLVAAEDYDRYLDALRKAIAAPETPPA